MPHWDSRVEPRWKQFKFNQPYAKGLARLKTEVLAKTDFDPATLFQWGTMQAMALVSVLEASEARFGAEGQAMVADAVAAVGLDVGRQILDGVELPEGMSEAEFFSFYATVINTIAYASLEDPKIDDEGKVSFHIIWCPHQDHYKAFDCRIQRYFVRGMIQAAQEHALGKGWQVKFDSTIPAGAQTCHFTLWNATDAEAAEWNKYTALLEAKALTRKRA
ncbi:MAG: hypothetical protein JO257_34180 [Deltaproteobacteria bacterium]|nr:hypothetical protein [Deltaproteobacteria bacterium]